MPDHFTYAIIGSGLAGVSAVEGIREVDSNGTILLIGREAELPYDRPALSKSLWLGKKSIEEVFLHDRAFYERHNTTLKQGFEATEVDVQNRAITVGSGESYTYEKLLFASGGSPRRLQIPGADRSHLCYYRTLADYRLIRERATGSAAALIIGGGFIGSEMAAALRSNDCDVTMVFGGPYLVDRVFPEGLGRAIQQEYERRGITVLSGDVPTAFEQEGDRAIVHTRSGAEIQADLVIVGIGIAPETALAESAGIEIDNGIVVDEYLRTSNSDLFAAGDNARFPYQALGDLRRIEHWDNALNQGKQAGRNMAGAMEAYRYMPYFFSDLFEFGYEAVGDVISELDVFADWRDEHKTGVLYYLGDGLVRGVMLCNTWDKVDQARELIRARTPAVEADLIGAIA